MSAFGRQSSALSARGLTAECRMARPSGGCFGDRGFSDSGSEVGTLQACLAAIPLMALGYAGIVRRELR